MTTIISTNSQGSAASQRGPDGLTDSQRFTKDHAHLSPSDYVFAKLAFAEQRSAERLASGEADHTFQARFNDRIFTIAGTRLDMSLLGQVQVPMVALAHPGDETAGASQTQSAARDVADGAGDYSDMSRQEIADAGRALFQAGEITLEELFVMEHPDGILRIDASGNAVELDPGQRMDFLAELRAAIRALEQTAAERSPGSMHHTMSGLLERLASAA